MGYGGLPLGFIYRSWTLDVLEWKIGIVGLMTDMNARDRQSISERVRKQFRGLGQVIEPHLQARAKPRH